MESLTNIARKFNMPYRQLKELLTNLYILEKFGRQYNPTEAAIEKGIAIRLSFNNGMVAKDYYKWDKELLQYYVVNKIKLDKPKFELPF